MVSATAIELDNVSKRYGSVTALEGIDGRVDAGAWVSITGPSGSGKTTLVNLIGCLDRPTSGRVILDGVEVSSLTRQRLTRFRAEKIGFIFQQFHLVPYLTALENVMLAQHFHSLADAGEAAAALARVGLDHRGHHRPSQLSGGEQQRVCIARALINNPLIILADEPTGNLDEENAAIVVALLTEAHRDGRTILMVTHDPAIAACATRHLQLRHGRLCPEAAEAATGLALGTSEFSSLPTTR